jgi:hypothetical protein
MSTRKISILLFLGLLLPLASCADRGPSAVVERFSASVASGDVDRALPLLSSQMHGMFGEQKLRMVLSQGVTQDRERGGVREFAILSETISEDGQTAVVETESTYGNGRKETGEFNLVREDDGWKIQMDTGDK